MTTLFIQLADADPQASASWWVCDEGEVTQSGSGEVSMIEAEITAGDPSFEKLETVVLVPDQEVLLVTVAVPGRSQARIRQAVPFAVEPFLTEELEDVHVAIGDVKRGDEVPCLVINRSRLSTYLGVFDETLIRPRIVTTSGMLTDAAADLFLIESDSRIVVRTSNELAVVAPQTLGAVIASMVERADSAPTIHCVGSDAFMDRTRNELARVDIQEESITATSLDAFISHVVDPLRRLSLLQGDFAVTDRNEVAKRTWQRTAHGIAASFVAVSVVFLLQGLWADLQTVRLQEQALDIYEGIFGTRAVVGNPVFRMQEQIGARAGQSSEWLSLLEGVVGAASDVEPTNLEYSEFKSEMTMTFTANDFGEFEELRTRIENLGLSIDVNVAEQQDNRVWARITISSA